MAERISKKTLKELKEPDFLQVELSKLTTFAALHKSKLSIIGVVFVVCIAIAAGWSLYSVNYEKSALQLYSQTETSAVKSGPSPNLITAYRNVITKYPRSQAALQAHYQLGNLYLNLNQVDLSLQAYDEFMQRAPRKSYLKYFAYCGQGYGYEVKKDYKNALISFENALKMPEADYLAGQVFRDMGRIYEEMNDPKKSLEYYRKSLEKTADSTMQMILKRKIAGLS
ncbi:MAG: tetratricopeptide repeat protein [Deltaproteobacteria bacterium]|nr:tetratricopeptide repeat protein [Deltaproteobacteria bacterium]